MADLDRIVCYVRLAHHEQFALALAEGLLRFGKRLEVMRSGDVPVECDAAVFWGARWPRIIAHQTARKRPFLIAEAGYFANPAPRLHYVSLGWGALNGRADFRNELSLSHRWNLIGPSLAEWRSESGEIVILGQTPGDHALTAIDYATWLVEIDSRLRLLFPGRRIRTRPHPNVGKAPPLALDLERAAFCVTYNSTSAVEAIMLGIPTYCEDPGCMAWPVRSETLVDWQRPERAQWAYNLAYCQWTFDEIRDGSALEHILCA